MKKETLDTNTLLEFCPKTSFCILSAGRVVHIGFEDILFVAKHGSHAIIYTVTARIKVYSPLQEILNDLPVNDFFRVNKSHIVSLQKIRRISGRKVEVNGCYIPITAYYHAYMKRSLGAILEQQYEGFGHLSRQDSRHSITHIRSHGALANS